MYFKINNFKLFIWLISSETFDYLMFIQSQQLIKMNDVSIVQIF